MCLNKFLLKVTLFNVVDGFSTDETTSENVLKAIQTFASLCGSLELQTPRDAFITALCKASLPPHYTLTVLSSLPLGVGYSRCKFVVHSV